MRERLEDNDITAAASSFSVSPPYKSWPKCSIVSDILEPSGAARKHRLTRNQWKKVREHRSWTTSVKAGKRLVPLDGRARTIGAKYRSSYLMQSEFVPCDDALSSSSSSSDEEHNCEEIRRPRFFTPRECARLQGFPESFRIEGKRNPNRWYHQCGNAVAPPIVAAIAFQILKVIHLFGFRLPSILKLSGNPCNLAHSRGVKNRGLLISSQLCSSSEDEEELDKASSHGTNSLCIR